jgi:Protein of unknown function (DUF664)
VAVRGGERAEFSLRWIYNHMIEEYARHNGHADLIRELVNGTAGQQALTPQSNQAPA